MRILLSGLILAILFAGVASAQETASATPDTTYDPTNEPSWAAISSVRTALVPFDADKRTVTSFVPFVYFDNDKYFFFRGLEGGVTFWRPGNWKISALGRLRFYDIPEDPRYPPRNSVGLLGFQARYQTAGPWHLDLEILSDLHGRELANVRAGAQWVRRKLTVRSYLQAQYKTSDFNSHFYGLNRETVGAGVELGVGASISYNLASNFILFGRAEASFLDHPVRDVSFISSDATAQVYVGIGLRDDPTITAPSVRKARPYLRLAQGRVSTSSLADILSGNGVGDPDNNRMTSLFYGHPVSDSMLGVPIQVFFTWGIGYHWPVKQETVFEFILGLKIYYSIPLPVRLRLGLGDGWSWVTGIPYVENYELREKGFEPNRLLNYLDFSVDLNLGDIFGGETLDRMWLGYGIHHRSAVFGSAEQFGNIKGGSNVQTVYLQYGF